MLKNGLAAFIHNLSKRYSARGFSAKEFRLTMTRSDIGNYLGLTVETISRLLGRFQKLGVLSVQGKYITINDINALIDLTGVHKNQNPISRNKLKSVSFHAFLVFEIKNLYKITFFIIGSCHHLKSFLSY